MERTKSFKSILSVMVLAVFVLFAGIFAGCEEDVKLELSVKGGVYEVQPGQVIEFDANYSKEVQTAVQFLVKSGAATFSADGKLTVSTTAQVGTEIEVYAKIDNTESNTIKVVVVDLKPTSITLNATNDKIAKGGSIDLSVAYIPSYATIKDYTLALSGDGAEYVEITNNVITVKEDADAAVIVNKTFTVTATLTEDETITSAQTITIVDAGAIDSILAKDVCYNVNKGAAKSVDITAFNAAGDVTESTMADYTFAYDESYIYIDSAGRIIPKKHGEVTVNVASLNGKTASFKVYVMIAPASMSLDNTKLSAQIIEKGEMSYSVDETYKLDIVRANAQYPNYSKKLIYTFELLNEDKEVVSTGDDVAEVDDEGNITFKTTGAIRITAKTDSALNGDRTMANYEKTVSLIVNVNNGVNIRTAQQFAEYSQQNNIVANILTNIYLTEQDNFGVIGNSKYATLQFYGDRTIYGNGYVVSNERLPLIRISDNSNEGDDMFRFEGDLTTHTPFTVKIYDLQIIGCSGVDGKYSGDLTAEIANEDKWVVNTENGKYTRTYKRGIKISGEQYNTGQTKYAYAKDVVLSNVSVTNFPVGLRLVHVVDGLLTEVEVNKCMSNGIESDQCIMTLNNITIGKVGAFAIEITPDSMIDKNTMEPKGVSGANYNQTPELKLTGYIKSENYSNGNDTLYMQLLKSQFAGYSMLQVAESIIQGYANGYAENYCAEHTDQNASEVASALLQKVLPCAEKEGQMNFYLLIFINPEEFTAYTRAPNAEGNENNRFAKYSFNSSTADILNVTEIMEQTLQNPDYDGYKAYKYICVDLKTGSLGHGHIGQVILINEAYDPEYVAA